MLYFTCIDTTKLVFLNVCKKSRFYAHENLSVKINYLFSLLNMHPTRPAEAKKPGTISIYEGMHRPFIIL